MHDCHEIGQTPLAFCYLLAEQNSPLYQFSIRAHKVNTVLEYHKSADELVIPPTYQPGLREFIEWETRKGEAEIRQLVADTERDCPIYNLVTNAQEIKGRIKRVTAYLK